MLFRWNTCCSLGRANVPWGRAIRGARAPVPHLHPMSRMPQRATASRYGTRALCTRPGPHTEAIGTASDTVHITKPTREMRQSWGYSAMEYTRREEQERQRQLQQEAAEQELLRVDASYLMELLEVTMKRGPFRKLMQRLSRFASMKTYPRHQQEVLAKDIFSIFYRWGGTGKNFANTRQPDVMHAEVLYPELMRFLSSDGAIEFGAFGAHADGDGADLDAADDSDDDDMSAVSADAGGRHDSVGGDEADGGDDDPHVAAAQERAYRDAVRAEWRAHHAQAFGPGTADLTPPEILGAEELLRFYYGDDYPVKRQASQLHKQHLEEDVCFRILQSVFMAVNKTREEEMQVDSDVREAVSSSDAIPLNMQIVNECRTLAKLTHKHLSPLRLLAFYSALHRYAVQNHEKDFQSEWRSKRVAARQHRRREMKALCNLLSNEAPRFVPLIKVMFDFERMSAARSERTKRHIEAEIAALQHSLDDYESGRRQKTNRSHLCELDIEGMGDVELPDRDVSYRAIPAGVALRLTGGKRAVERDDSEDGPDAYELQAEVLDSPQYPYGSWARPLSSEHDFGVGSGTPRVWLPETSMSPITLARTEADKRRHAIDIRRAKLPHLDKEIKRAKSWESALENDLAAAMTSYAAGVHTLVAVRFMLKQIGTRNEDAAWDWDDIHTDHARVHQLVQSRTRSLEPEVTSQGFWGQMRGAVRAAAGAGETDSGSTPLPSPSARLANRFSSLLTREEYRSCYKLILNYQVQMKGDAASREGLLASLRKICGEESWPLLEPLVEEHLADFDVQYMIMQQWQAPPTDEDHSATPTDVVEDPDFRIRNRPMHDSIGRFALDRGVQSMTQQDMIDLGIEARRRLKERKSRGAHGGGDWGFAVRTSSPEEQLEQADADHELYEDDTPQQRVGRVLDTYLTLSEILAQKHGGDGMAPIQTTFERPANEKYKVFVDQLPMYATLEDVRDCLSLCGKVVHVSKSNGFLDEMRRIKSQRVRAGMRLKQQKDERQTMRQQRMAKFADIQAQREKLKETKASMKQKSKDPVTLRKTSDLHLLFKKHCGMHDSLSLGDFRDIVAQYTCGGPERAQDGTEADEDFPLDRIFAAAVNETVLRRKLGLQLPLGGSTAYEAAVPTLDELRVLTQFRHGKKLIQKVFVKLHHIEDAKDDPRKDRLLLVKGLVEQLRQEQHEARIERERQRRELKLASSRLEASVNADSLMQMLDMLAEKTGAPFDTASAREGQPWTLTTSTQEDGASDLEMLAGICAVHGLQCADDCVLNHADDAQAVDEIDDSETKQWKRLSKHILTAHRDRKTQFQHTADQREMDKKRAKLAKKHELAKWRKERGLPAKASGFAKPRAGINERQKDLSREFPALTKRSNYSAFVCFEDEESMKRALIPELQIFGMLFNSPLRSEEEYIAHNRPQVVDMVLSQGPPRQEFLKAMAALHVALNDLEQSSENTNTLQNDGVGQAHEVDDTMVMLPESASHLFDFDVSTPFTEDDMGYGRKITLNGCSGPVQAWDGLRDGDTVVEEQSLSKQIVGKIAPPPDGTLVFRDGSSAAGSAEDAMRDTGNGTWRHGVVDGTVLLNGGAVSALAQALHKHDHVFQELKYVRTFEEALNLRDSEGLDIYRTDEAKRNELISAGLERALFWRQEDEDALKRGLITLVAASAKKQKHDAKRFGKGRKKIEDITRRQHEAKKDIDALFSRTLRSEFKLMCDKLSKQGEEYDDDDDDDDENDDDVEDEGDQEHDDDEDDDDMDELADAEDMEEDDEDARGQRGTKDLPLFHSLLYGQEKQTLQQLGDKAYEEVMQKEREEAYRDAYEMALQLAGVSESELDSATRAMIEDEARQAEMLAAQSARWAALTAMNYARDKHAMSEASDFGVFADVWEDNIAKMQAEEASSRRCRIMAADEKVKLHVQYPLALEKHGVHERKQQWPLVEDVLKELDNLAGSTARLELGDESLDSGRVSRKRFCVIDFPSHEQASAVAKALDGKTFTDAMGNLRRVHVGWWS